MDFWIQVLKLLDASMPTPQPYGAFHLLSFAFYIALAIVLCKTHKKGDDRRVRRVVRIIAVITFILELYKQINYAFDYSSGQITFDYAWYAFPWQFCSTPLYVGLIAGFTRKGKLHQAMCAYLATFSVFAGICVMFYPTTVFISTIGINIQTMFCHGTMITMGVYLLYSGYVKLEHKTILKALPVFMSAVAIAMIMNEVAYQSGLLETDVFNMFFISPYCEPSLPLYSLIQPLVPFGVSVAIYVTAFTLAAYLVLLAAMGIAGLGAYKKIRISA